MMTHETLDGWRNVCDPHADAALEELMPGGRGALGFGCKSTRRKRRL